MVQSFRPQPSGTTCGMPEVSAYAYSLSYYTIEYTNSSSTTYPFPLLRLPLVAPWVVWPPSNGLCVHRQDMSVMSFLLRHLPATQPGALVGAKLNGKVSTATLPTVTGTTRNNQPRVSPLHV